MTETGTRYELRSELARGGMGVVYSAFDHLARRELAYKRLSLKNASAHATGAALFEREFNALAKLRHPNIVQVYEYGIDDEGPYYTMELLVGSDLFRSSPLELQSACSVLREVASALALVHARRLVHRDITPMNVRLDPEGRTRLIDFGALAAFGPSQEIVGTPQFTAPECFTGAPLDGRVDLFALGALAYWTLTRKPAFQASSLLERRTNPDPIIAPPSAHVPGLPKALDELVLSLLRPDPLARPNSAAEVMQQLSQIADLPPEPKEKQVAFSYLAHPPLVGRAEPLASMHTSLEYCAKGVKHTVFVEGRSGLGRSAFLDQVAIDAQLGGLTVLRAQGGAAAPFDLAESLLRAGTQRCLLFAQPGEARATPSLAATSADGPVAVAIEKRGTSPAEMAAHHANRVDTLVGQLVLLCVRGPVVMLIDDADRADPQSLAVLAALSRSAANPALLLVLAADRASLVRESALLLLERNAETLTLSPLGSTDLNELVGSVFGDVPNTRRLSLWLHEYGGGSPAVCMELLRRLLLDGQLQYTTGTFNLPYDLPAPSLTREQANPAASRLRELSETALRVARTLSLQRERLPVELVIAALELEATAAVAALDELNSKNVVRMNDGHVWIADEAIRAGLESSFDEDSRRACHLQVGRALLSRGYHQGIHRLLVGANLLRGGDEDTGTRLIAETRLGSGVDPGYAIDSQAALPLLETALENRRRDGIRDEHNLPLLVALTNAGYYGDYGSQCKYGDRALDALLKVSGIKLAKRLQPLLGGKLGLYVALAVAVFRFVLTPQSARLGNFRDTMATLAMVAGASVACYASAIDAKKALAVMERLSPLRVLPETHQLRIAYEFSLAVTESTAGKYALSTARYERLAVAIEHPLTIADPSARSTARSAVQLGQSQAQLTFGSPRTLELTELLRGAHPFFAAPAEATCTAYFAARGELAAAEKYRERAELAALRNGMSWSAVTLLTVRMMYANILSRNMMGLMQTISELKRLSRTVPNLELFRDLARAYALHLGGQHSEALEIYERVIRDPRHVWLPTAFLHRTQHAEVLAAAGRCQEAKDLCLQILADSQEVLAIDQRQTLPTQQLALVEAALGDCDAAVRHLDNCIAALAARDNPLLIGACHRDRAQVALLAGDEPAFNRHLATMSEHFRSTQNPWLIRQCEQLVHQAQNSGIVVELTLPSSGISSDVFETALAHGDAFESDSEHSTELD